MKSITIHGVDDPLAELIKSRAREEGLSVNKTVKKLLEESLGVRPSSTERNRNTFVEFCGTWSESELKEFDAGTKDLREIDTEDWQ
jgi:hypothetical protein